MTITLENANFEVFKHVEAAVNHYCQLEDMDRYLLVEALSPGRLLEVREMISYLVIFIGQYPNDPPFDVECVRDLANKVRTLLTGP